jgi:hypothetical protein
VILDGIATLQEVEQRLDRHVPTNTGVPPRISGSEWTICFGSMPGGYLDAGLLHHARRWISIA